MPVFMPTLTRAHWDEVIPEGVAWLRDKYGDRWFHLINEDALALSNVEYCILGQLEGNFYRALGKHGLTWDRAADLGFAVRRSHEGYGVMNSYVHGTDAWVATIKALKAIA